MTLPIATYRIQFRNGMTFDRATECVPYLKRLGISHLYASPIFTATSGSTHGYDVTDANEIDPALGGFSGFERMAKRLKRQGMGLILDIVPNHMAASLENRWWRDVVKLGKDSLFARYFDIDWSRRLTLPVLGESFEDAVRAGHLSLGKDPVNGEQALVYFDTHFPLSPSNAQQTRELAELHERQAYRLMHWREAARDLSYRRFFEITGLVGIRVEDPSVFADSHRLIIDLATSGLVDGLRIDHVDGLADPRGYLERLRRAVGDKCYITVEKILGEDELLPGEWPVSGTTGYEFIKSLSNIFVNQRGLQTLQNACSRAAGGEHDAAPAYRAAKLLMIDRNFAGEFDALLRAALEANRRRDGNPLLDEGSIRTALRELLCAFPVYRTYGTVEGLPAPDATLLERVIADVLSGRRADSNALQFVESLLKSAGDEIEAEVANRFRTRFQQLTGPLMAKAVEDTLFFRQNALLAINEVGAPPLGGSFSIDRFHRDMAERARTQPAALSATSTHDTKRGEDARARLYALTEIPQSWADAVERWRRMNACGLKREANGAIPEPEVEWMLYQSLAGVWPGGLSISDREGLGALSERFNRYVEKALREAKLRTDWADPDEDYEKAVLAYASRMLSPDNQEFLADFVTTLEPIVRAGWINSLSQTVIKLTAPGVPDIYQGSEMEELSLLDPDNRRAPDFAGLQEGLIRNDGVTPPPIDVNAGELKQVVIASLLRFRRDHADLFTEGSYLPLLSELSNASRIIAFARMHGTAKIIVVASRMSLLSERPVEHLPLPASLANNDYIDVFDGDVQHLNTEIPVDLLLEKRPFAILYARA